MLTLTGLLIFAALLWVAFRFRRWGLRYKREHPPALRESFPTCFDEDEI